MKNLKKMVLPALLCCGITAMIVSCKDENVEKSVSDSKEITQNAIEKLVALGDKLNPNTDEIQEFQSKYKSLNFDELIQFRKVQHEQIKSKIGIENDVVEKLNKDMNWFINLNKQSIALFGKPMNQASDSQMNEVFVAVDKANDKKSKVAASCPVINFTTSFTKGVGGSTNLSPNSAREVDPGAQNDCDCQLAFGTSNTNFRKVKPLTTNASNLLNDFGNNLGGRQLTGASAGSFPVWGKIRVTLRYPAAITSTGCNVLLNQYTLSNN